MPEHVLGRPASGWRRVVYAATGGAVNPGIGPAEQRRHELAQRIGRRLARPRQIAVVSLKGGVGVTTVTALLSLTFAGHRGDRVVALDANPDAGTLADRLTGTCDSTVRNLLDEIDDIGSLSDVARFTTVAGRLHVLASEQDPALSEEFTRAEYEQVRAVLTRFYDLVIVDAGTGIVHHAMEGGLTTADGVVIVGSPTVDGVSRASRTLDWLVARGQAERAARAVVALCGGRSSEEVDPQRMREYFASRCRAVVEIPYDPHLASVDRVDLAAQAPATSDAFLEMAALLADEFEDG
jgi:MinD-like ATPase involved in chromosome partitioning or flagellar assembly